MQDLGLTPKHSPAPFTFRLKRLLWALIDASFIRFSPPHAYSFRNYILRLFGARIGFRAGIKPSTRILMPWNLVMADWIHFGPNVTILNYGPVTIGSHTVISRGSFLCGGTHDYRKPDLPLICGSISIGNCVWICADVYIGPSTIIGDNCVVAARSVIVKDMPCNSIYGGNPAKFIKSRI